MSEFFLMFFRRGLAAVLNLFYGVLTFYLIEPEAFTPRVVKFLSWLMANYELEVAIFSLMLLPVNYINWKKSEEDDELNQKEDV